MCSHRRFAPSLIIILSLLLTSTAGTTEVTPEKWKKSVSVDITTTQTSYSDSWVGGEAGSVNWVSNLNTLAEKPLKHWFELKTTLKLSFGQTLTQDAEDKSWSKPKKSTDLIDCENVGRFTIDKFVDPYIAFRIESQFMDASDTLKKLYFNPVKLTESVGISRDLLKSNGNFITSRLGLGLRQIIKSSVDSELVIVDSTLVDGGIESVTDFEIHVNEKLRYTGKLTLYKAMYFSRMDDVKGTAYEDDWKTIDINWENIISASITKIVTVNLYTQLLYDKEVSKKGRFKQTLAIGFVFKMM